MAIQQTVTVFSARDIRLFFSSAERCLNTRLAPVPGTTGGTDVMVFLFLLSLHKNTR
jgi:hypothetical protein